MKKLGMVLLSLAAFGASAAESLQFVVQLIPDSELSFSSAIAGATI